MDQESSISQGIQSERVNNILVVTLDRPPCNALNSALIEALHTAVDTAIRDDDVRGMVLGSNVPGVFCCGFDVHEVSQYDRETVTLFFARFIELYESLYLLPKPVIGAISGHSDSWGVILALACDLRIFGRGDFRFAFSQINAGIPLPPGLVRILVGTLGPSAARELLFTCSGIVPERALSLGLAHEIVDQVSIKSKALAECTILAGKPAKTFADLKRSLRIASGHPAEGEDRDSLPEIVEYWYSADMENRKQALLSSSTPRATPQ